MEWGKAWSNDIEKSLEQSNKAVGNLFVDRVMIGIGRLMETSDPVKEGADGLQLGGAVAT